MVAQKNGFNMTEEDKSIAISSGCMEFNKNLAIAPVAVSAKNYHHKGNQMRKILFKRFVLTLITILVFGYSAKHVFAQTSQSVLYVPLIGLTSVPEPLALPNGAGNVTYHYAVKNFLQEFALTSVRVVDNKCGPVTFVTGDDNSDSKLDYSETWRYACTAKLSNTLESVATATGSANNITATDKAYATVIVGTNNPAPLVSIVNITKVAYPLSLPAEGGDITFNYRVNNPGVVPLSNVIVTDDKCGAMSGKLGDTNGNNLLDIQEVWIYTCAMHLTQTTTNTATVKAVANGLKAVDNFSLTVKVDSPIAQPILKFPDTGANHNLNATVWATLLGVLVVLITTYVLIRKKNWGKHKRKLNF